MKKFKTGSEKSKGRIELDQLSFDSTFDYFETDELETKETVSAQSYAKETKIETINMLKKEHLADIMPAKPEPGKSYHLISNGGYDFFTFIPVLVEYMGFANVFYGSTWTMNRNNVQMLFQMVDKGQIREAAILTGLYFKRREAGVYSMLLNGMMKRGFKYKCFENHSKITLLGNEETNDWIIIEGSANYTANPRLEQYVINNHKGLFDFHKSWMDEVLDV